MRQYTNHSFQCRLIDVVLHILFRELAALFVDVMSVNRYTAASQLQHAYPFGQQQSRTNGINANFRSLRLGQTFRQVQYYNVIISQTPISLAIIKKETEDLQAAFVTEYGMLLPPGIIPYL